MEIEIKIPLLDNATEAAKDFLQKVVGPPLEEVGLLFADRVKLWRLKNKINVINKAEEYLKTKNYTTKKVTIKVLSQILDFAALEDDEGLQDKWAALLANTVSEHMDITTTLYSHLLSQLTNKDAEIFNAIFDSCASTVKSGVSTVTYFMKGGVFMCYSNFRKEYNDIDIIIDNLIRLRLIVEYNPSLNECVSLTSLGFSFMNACRIL